MCFPDIATSRCSCSRMSTRAIRSRGDKPTCPDTGEVEKTSRPNSRNDPTDERTHASNFISCCYFIELASQTQFVFMMYVNRKQGHHSYCLLGSFKARSRSIALGAICRFRYHGKRGRINNFPLSMSRLSLSGVLPKL